MKQHGKKHNRRNCDHRRRRHPAPLQLKGLAIAEDRDRQRKRNLAITQAAKPESRMVPTIAPVETKTLLRIAR